MALFFGRRRLRRPRRWRRRLVVLAIYLLILGAGLLALRHFVPDEVVEAIRNTYLNPSIEIDR